MHVRCMGNFRSPRRVVDVINQLKLTFTRAQFRLKCVLSERAAGLLLAVM